MRLIALDTETDGLTARYDASKKVWCIGLAWEGNNGSIHSIAYEWDNGAAAIKQLLADPQVTFVIHNSAFDIAVLRTRGINIPSGRYHDSMLAAYLAQPGSDVSLGTLSTTCGYPKLDFKQNLIDAGHLPKTARDGAEFELDYSVNRDALDLLKAYCGRDCEAALAVFKQVWKQHYTEDDKLRKAYLELELPYVECVVDMETTGMFIDAVKMSKLKRNLEKRIDALTRVINKMVPYVPEIAWSAKDKKYVAAPCEYKTGKYTNKTNVPKQYYTYDGKLHASEPNTVYNHCKLQDFNMNASRHLCWVLQQQGWKPEEYSKKSGEPITNADVIKSIADKYSITRVFAAHQTYSKLVGTFIDGINRATDSLGYAHGSFNQTTTKTTRLSSSNPNLQNLPARTALGKKIRECVIAPPGYVLAVADLDQIEIRVLAYYLEKVMKEPRMADAARKLIDAHQANADAWGVTRKEAKGGIFAVLYGAMAAKLSEGLKCSEAKAQSVIDGINNGMPAIQGLKDKVWGNLRIQRKGVKLQDEDGKDRADGILYSLYGCRLVYHSYNHRFGNFRSKAERQSFNALIQGSAANVQKELSLRALSVLKRYDCKMVAAVHDETLVYIPEKFSNTVLSQLNDIYKCYDILRTANGGVPVTGEWNIGENWNEAKDG